MKRRSFIKGLLVSGASLTVIPHDGKATVVKKEAQSPNCHDISKDDYLWNPLDYRGEITWEHLGTSEKITRTRIL